MASELIRLIARQADGRGWLGVTAFALLLAAPLLFAWMALPLLDASRIPPPATATPLSSAAIDGNVRAFEDRLGKAGTAVANRSPFYPPRPKIAPPPPTPARYAGPALIAMAFGEAWFADGTRLMVGDPAVNELELIELNEPWTARVRWRGAEFTVTLFDREPVKLSGGLDDIAPPPPPPDSPARRRPESSSGSGSSPSPASNPNSGSGPARPRQGGDRAANPGAGRTRPPNRNQDRTANRPPQQTG